MKKTYKGCLFAFCLNSFVYKLSLRRTPISVERKIRFKRDWGGKEYVIIGEMTSQ